MNLIKKWNLKFILYFEIDLITSLLDEKKRLQDTIE